MRGKIDDVEINIIKEIRNSKKDNYKIELRDKYGNTRMRLETEYLPEGFILHDTNIVKIKDSKILKRSLDYKK